MTITDAFKSPAPRIGEPRESYRSLLARTQPIVDADLGPSACAVCGAACATGRRTGDPRFVCLAGCGTRTLLDELAALVAIVEGPDASLAMPDVAARLRRLCAGVARSAR